MKQKIAKGILVLSLIGMISGCSKTPDRTIEFVTNDGTPISAITGRPGQAIEGEIATSRDGYKFLGWYSDKELTNRVSSIVSFPYADVTLYAKWGKIVTISFETNGGSAKTAIEGVEGDSIDLGDDPTKENNYFTNWYTSTNLSEETLFTLDVFSDIDYTLYAGWEAYPTISFDSNYIVEGQTSEYTIPSISVDKGADLSKVKFPNELVALADIDEKDVNVEFAGWFIEETNEDGASISTQFYLNGTMPDHSVTLIGRWNTLRTITYVTNVEGENIPSTSAYSGHEISVPTRPNNPGYHFEGWFEKAEDGTISTTPFNFASMPNRDITLVASWTLNPVATFIDGFEIDNLGASYLEPTQNVSFDVGTTVETPIEFLQAHSGYTMIGWYTKNEDNTYSRYRMTNNMFTGEKDISLYARYAKTVATVSFYDTSNLTTPIDTRGLNYSDPTALDVSSLEREQCPTIEGKVVVDWYTGYENGDFIGNPITYPFTTDKDISLFAKTVDKVELTLIIGSDKFVLTGGATLPVTIAENVKAAYNAFITANSYSSVNWFIQDGDLTTTIVYDLKVFPDSSMTLVLGKSDTPFTPDIDL